MQMNKKIKFLVSILFFLMILSYPTVSYSQDQQDDGVFLTLTRKPEPRINLPTNLTVVTNKDMDNKNAKTLDEALDFTNSVNIGKIGTLGAETTMILRGALDKQTLVLVDGRPVNDISTGKYNFSELNTQNIERIEIIRGAASSVYGANALAGVVNIITKDTCPEKLISDINMSFGGFGEKIYGITAAKKTGNFETNVSLNKMLSDGFRQNSSYDNNDFDFYLGLNSGNSGNFKLRGGYTTSNLGSPGQNYTPIAQWNNDVEKMAQDPDANQKTNKNYVSLFHETDLMKDVKLNSGFYVNSESNRYASPVAFTDTKTDKLTTGLNVKCGLPYGLTAGLELKQDKAISTDELFNNVNYDQKVDWSSLYFQEEYSVSKKLNTIIGLRYDNNSYFGGQTSPQFTIVWRPEQNWKLSSNIGKSYRAPTFEDLFVPYMSWPASMWGPAGDSQGNTNLKPETSLSYDIGVERKWQYNIVTQVTLFQQDVDNLIQWANVSANPLFQQWRPSNVSQSYNKGCELQFKQWLNDKLSYTVDYTYLESKGKNSTGQDYQNLMYRPVNMFNCIISYKMPWKSSVALTGKYVGEQYDESNNLVSSYNLFNVRVEKTFFDYSKVYFSINNVNDMRYFTRAGFPLSGRTVSAGFNLSF
jgi:outer membrane cobalamin receptor